MPIVFDTLEEFEEFCKAFEIRPGTPSVKPLPQQKTSIPAKGSKLPKPSKGKATTIASKPKKNQQPKRASRENSLTAQVQAAIDTLISAKTAFSAKDVFAQVVKTNVTAPKATVLSITSKIISTKYSHLASEERPSEGTRPLKVFLP